MCDAFRLGASMYIPCNSPHLMATFSGQKYPHVRSLIACTEDAVLESDVPEALAQLETVIRSLPETRSTGPMRFVRARNPEILKRILDIDGVGKLHGFVLPKADADSMPAYAQALGGTDFRVMPTLETIGVFDEIWRRDMRQYLLGDDWADRIITLRIGANDLLKHLGLRRMRGVTIYETPIGTLIDQLVLSFRPWGFHLTAPVYDYFDDPDTLAREVAQDVLRGLVGKTAIHPVQAAIIEQGLQVSRHDLDIAKRILDDRQTKEAVFRHDGGMIELSVHTSWAEQTVARAVSLAPRDPTRLS